CPVFAGAQFEQQLSYVVAKVRIRLADFDIDAIEARFEAHTGFKANHQKIEEIRETRAILVTQLLDAEIENEARQNEPDAASGDCDQKIAERCEARAQGACER